MESLRRNYKENKYMLGLEIKKTVGGGGEEIFNCKITKEYNRKNT